MTPAPPSALRDDAQASGAASYKSREPVMSLPTRTLLLSLVAVALLIAGFWSLVVMLGPWGQSAFTSGMAGITVTSAMSLVGVLIISPWKPRPMGDWMTMWMAATVFRLLGTPIVLFLLYSAASKGSMALSVKPLVLSVALTYLVMVLAEAGIIASHVRRLLPSP